MFTVLPYNLFSKLFPPVNIRYIAVNCLVLFTITCANLPTRERNNSRFQQFPAGSAIVDSSSRPARVRIGIRGARQSLVASPIRSPLLTYSSSGSFGGTGSVFYAQKPTPRAFTSAHFISCPHQLSTRDGVQQADENEGTTRSLPPSDISQSAVSCQSKLARWTKRSSVAGGGDAFG